MAANGKTEKEKAEKGKAACVLVFLAVLAAVSGILIGMIKMDAGGFASTVLAPAIGDIPVVRSVLPQNLQRKNQSEIAASEQAQAAADSEAAASEKAISDAALQDYVDTYSNMKPKAAATVFDTMMPDQMLLVTKILKEMTPSQRSAILAQMNAQNASDITVEMNKELP